MNISRAEQRVLHVLALGGEIRHLRDGKRIVAVDCLTSDGARLDGVTLDLFHRLKRRGMVASRGGRPYRITRTGLSAVRAQLDNRG